MNAHQNQAGVSLRRRIILISTSNSELCTYKLKTYSL